jgi:DNA replication protein DnaC
VGKSHLALAVAWEWVERFERQPWEILGDRELGELFENSQGNGWNRWRGISEKPRYRRPVYPRDHGVRFARVGDLLDLLQRGYDNGLYYELLQECQSCRLLVLDDLGHQRETPWRVEMVDRIIDARYMGGRWTVITTNLPGDQLPPRIASRLRDRSTGFVAAIEAGDYRPHKRRNGRTPW